MGLKLDELIAGMKVEKEVAERNAFEADQWQRILVRFPQIKDIEANYMICREACYPQDLTLDSIELLVTNDESFVKQLALGTPEAIKQDLITKIVGLMDPAEGPYAAKNRAKSLSFLSLERLRGELRNAEARVKLREKTPEELRQIIRQSKPVPGYPALPRKIVPPGSVKAVDLDRAYLLRLDAESLRKICRIYSNEAVNARLAGE